MKISWAHYGLPLIRANILSSHGLPSKALHEVAKAMTLERFLYTAPVQWGFSSTANWTLIEHFVERTIRMGFLPQIFWRQLQSLLKPRSACSQRSSCSISHCSFHGSFTPNWKHYSLANPILVHPFPCTSLPVSTPNTIDHSRLSASLTLWILTAAYRLCFG